MKASPKTMWVDQPMYRVRVDPDRVSIMNFDITELHVQLDKYYNNVDDLPNWVKERLAILMMTSPNPPTETIEGIGRRIRENVFWVFVPEQGE